MIGSGNSKRKNVDVMTNRRLPLAAAAAAAVEPCRIVIT